MSWQATSWAARQTAGNSGRKALLLLIANAANANGVSFEGRKALARECECRPETVSANLGALEAAKLIARFQRRRDNGSRTTDWIVLAPYWPDRGEMRDGDPQELPEAVARASTKRSGEDFQREENETGQVRNSGSPETVNELNSLSSSSPPATLDLEDGMSQEIRCDAATLLASKTKVGARLVAPKEMGIAAAALAEFNRQANANYGLGGHLSALVGRIRERPSMTAEQHVRLVRAAWRDRWWERNGNGRRPAPGVIYGTAAVFERAVQDATDEANGVKREAPAAVVAQPVRHDRYSDKRQREIEREEAAQRVLAARRLQENQ